MFREIAGAEAAVLVHCAAGRDRTGMVIARRLHPAGKAPVAIADDYVAAMIRFNAGWGVVPGLAGERPQSAEVMAERISSRRHVMLDWLVSPDVGAHLRDARVGESEVDGVKTDGASRGCDGSYRRKDGRRGLGLGLGLERRHRL